MHMFDLFDNPLVYVLLLTVAVGTLIWRLRKLTAVNRNLRQELASTTQQLQMAITARSDRPIRLRDSNRLDNQKVAMLLHDLRSPIRFMAVIINSIARNFDKRTKRENLQCLVKLQTSTTTLWNLLEASYAWSMMQDDFLKVNIQKVAIQDVFSKIEKYYEDLLSFSGNRLEVTDTSVYWNADTYILMLIVRNLIDNANKNTVDGIIRLGCEQVGNKLQIYVEDTGRGLTASEIKAFLHSDEQRVSGSHMIQYMLRKIQGKLMIRSCPGAGSRFTIELHPLNIAVGINPHCSST